MANYGRVRLCVEITVDFYSVVNLDEDDVTKQIEHTLVEAIHEKVSSGRVRYIRKNKSGEVLGEESTPFVPKVRILKQEK